MTTDPRLVYWLVERLPGGLPAPTGIALSEPAIVAATGEEAARQRVAEASGADPAQLTARLCPIELLRRHLGLPEERGPPVPASGRRRTT